MSVRRNSLTAIALGCLLGVIWPLAAEAQIRAMPANTVIDRSQESPPNVLDIEHIDPYATPSEALAQVIDSTFLESATVSPAAAWREARSTPAPVANNMGPLLVAEPPPSAYRGYWTWQVLPERLMYRSYMAGGKESRFASHWIHERDQGWLWDVTLGGRVGVLRFGSEDPLFPEGWQIDIEGAAFPRMDFGNGRDLVASDYRFGIPLTVRRGRWEGKFSYYHLSSHLGDEHLVRTGDTRINFVRDALVLGGAYYLLPDMRLYTEAGWSFHPKGGSRPWEFQFGVDWSSLQPTGICGSPFFAINGEIRQEVGFGGSMTVQNGWQWRGPSGHLLRVGMHYFNGKTYQYQFFTEHEEQLGVGMWYDF